MLIKNCSSRMDIIALTRLEPTMPANIASVNMPPTMIVAPIARPTARSRRSPVVRVHEPGEDVMVLFKEKDDVVRALLVVVAESDEWVLVRIRGKLDQVMEQHPEIPFSRIPVYEADTKDQITGYVLKDEMLARLVEEGRAYRFRRDDRAFACAAERRRVDVDVDVCRGALEVDGVRQPLVVDARGVDRRLQIQAVAEDVEHHLQHRVDDGPAAG